MVRETKPLDNPPTNKILFRNAENSRLSQILEDFGQSQRSYLVFLQPEQEETDGPLRGYGATTLLDTWYEKISRLGKPRTEFIKATDNKHKLDTGLTSLTKEIVDGFLATNKIASVDVRQGLSWFFARFLAVLLIIFIAIVATVIFAASVAQILALLDYESFFGQLAVSLEKAPVILLLVFVYTLLLGLSYLAYRSTALDNVRKLVNQYPPPWQVRARFAERAPKELVQGLMRYSKKDHDYVFIIDDLDYSSATDILSLRNIFDTLTLIAS